MSGDFNFYRYVGGDPVNRADPTGLFDPVADAIMRPVGHELPTTPPMTWEDFVPGCVAAAKDLFSGDLSIGAAAFNALPLPNIPKSSRKKKKECDKKEKANKKDGESVEDDKKKKCKDPKGIKTESAMDKYYKSKGYEKINTNNGKTGIDGVYKNKVTGEYVVADAKYNSAGLASVKDPATGQKDIKQMSKRWVQDRLEKELSEEDLLAISKKGYKPKIFKVDPKCNKSLKNVTQKGDKGASVSRQGVKKLGKINPKTFK